MQNFRELGSGKTYGFFAKTRPEWQSAYVLWLQNAKEV
jgi:hypothetical protein